jgi:hypothetical protein
MRCTETFWSPCISLPEHINIKERTLCSWPCSEGDWCGTEGPASSILNPRRWMELSASGMQQPQLRGCIFCVHGWEKANRNARWLWQCGTCLCSCSVAVGVSQTAGKPNRNEGRCQNLPDTRLLVWPACENLHSPYDPVNIVWVTESR